MASERGRFRTRLHQNEAISKRGDVRTRQVLEKRGYVKTRQA